ELVVDNGKGTRPAPIEVSNVPTLTISLANDPNLGSLEVKVRDPGVTITIDGGKPRPLHAGTNYPRVQPGKHMVRLAQEGYEPVQQPVEVKKGEVVPVAFEPKPIARTASLVIEGAARDTEVWIAGANFGVVQGDGTFRKNDVPPGDHIILLKRTDF